MKRLIPILALLAVASAAPAAIVAVENVEYPVESFWAAMDANFDGSRIAANFGGDIWLWEAGTWTHVDEGHPFTSSVGISADGTAIISAQDDPNTGLRNPAIWYEANGWADPTLLGGIAGYGPCDNSVGSGYALNHDGSIAVGLGWNDCTGVAFMWTAASGMVDIGGVRASMISDDGTVVTGFDHADWGGRRANVWYNDPSQVPPAGVDGPYLLGDPDDAPGEGYDTTSDGSMICGEHFPADSGWFFSRAMAWTEATGIIELGILGGNENHRSIATHCSDDGKVCGVSGDPPPWGMWDVFLWTESEGMLQLKQLCLESGATLPDGFTDNNLVGVLTLSNDGSTLLVAWQDDMWNQGAYKISFESSVAIDPDEEQPGEALPQAVTLRQNYPNPFNPMTSIAFSLPVAEQVKLAVYDVMGRHVRTLHDGTASAGEHTVVWDGTDRSGKAVPSGTYVYRLITDSRIYHRTMTIAK